MTKEEQEEEEEEEEEEDAQLFSFGYVISSPLHHNAIERKTAVHFGRRSYYFKAVA